MKGPLSDYTDRLVSLAKEMQKDPRIRVGLRFEKPLDGAKLEKLAASWKVDAFSPALANLYSQANGFVFVWVSTHHPDYSQVIEAADGLWDLLCSPSIPTSSGRHPNPHDVECLHQSVPFGMICLLPLEKALKKGSGFIDYTHGSFDGSSEANGVDWQTKDIRVFDYASTYSPVGFLMAEGVSDPTLAVGSDHGAGWEIAKVDFAAYMEGLLGSQGRTDARPAMAGGGELPGGYEEQLPPSTVLESTSAPAHQVEVLSVSDVDAAEVQARKIAGEHLYYKDVAKVLEIGDRSKRSALEVCRDIVRQMGDVDSMDIALVKKLMSAAKESKRTKKAFKEAFFTDAEGGVCVNLRITANFSDKGLSVKAIDSLLLMNIDQFLGDRAKRTSPTVVVEASGRKTRVVTVEMIVESSHALEEGQSSEVALSPPGYREYKGVMYKEIG